jgi:hypothetical protein
LERDMSKVEPESYEVTEYSDPDMSLDQKIAVIAEIVQNKVAASPNLNTRVSFTGNLMKLTFHCYEMHAPVRMRIIEDMCKETLNKMIKDIKKEFKEKTGAVLNPKEQKDLGNYTIQKVSLNERYLYASWRFYELE